MRKELITSSRKEFLKCLAKIIRGIKKPHPLRVAIDGVDASGKTVIAEQIAAVLKSCRRQIIRVSIDGFHNPRRIRYAGGGSLARQYYKNSFDNTALLKNTLKPLGPKGSLIYKGAIFDFKSDKKVFCAQKRAEKNAIIIMDGVFLLRPELVNYWDFKIFVKADFKTTLRRACKRDGYLFGEKKEIISRYRRRYIPGQKIYLAQAKPHKIADIVINNVDFNTPFIEANRYSASAISKKAGFNSVREVARQKER